MGSVAGLAGRYALQALSLGESFGKGVALCAASADAVADAAHAGAVAARAGIGVIDVEPWGAEAARPAVGGPALKTVADVATSEAVGAHQDVAVSLATAGAVVEGVAGEVLDAGIVDQVGPAEARKAEGWLVVYARGARHEAVQDADSRGVGVVA